MNSLDKMEDYDRLARLCEAKDAEIVAIKTYAEKMQRQRHSFRDVLDVAENNLDEAQEQIVMLRTALEFAYQKKYHSTKIDVIENALSATSETVAAWRVKETEPYKREVAMLRTRVAVYANHDEECASFDGNGCSCGLISELKDTQATALAYEREVKAKALRVIAEKFSLKDGAGFKDELFEYLDSELRTNKGDAK